jgi:hypothetical protein
MRIAIVGSRTFANLQLVRDFVARLPGNTIVVSGGAPGVDTIAELEARRCGLKVLVIRPQWKNRDGSFRRQAGFTRNVEIVREAEQVVAFWDGLSKGTAHTIGVAKEAGKLFRVYGPEDTLDET